MARWLLGLLCAGGSAAFVINSRCATPGQCQTFNDTACVAGTEPECGCLPSQRGTLCVECSRLGYLDGSSGVCRCYDSTFDPNNVYAPCSPIVATTTSEVVQQQHSRATCACHATKELGFFALDQDPLQHVFGDANPPTCNACLGAIWGPEVGVIGETLRIPLQTCNSYGGPDPLKGPNGWYSCSGHGAWAGLPAYRCTCDAGWMLRDTGLLGAGGEPGVTCDACRPFRGEAADGCRTITTPDPISGVAAECSGHGLQQVYPQQCECFNNGTHGHWALKAVSAKFTTLQYVGAAGTAYTLIDETVTASTCAACVGGYSLASGCLS